MAEAEVVYERRYNVVNWLYFFLLEYFVVYLAGDQ